MKRKKKKPKHNTLKISALNKQVDQCICISEVRSFTVDPSSAATGTGQDCPNLGHIRMFFRWLVVPGWHFVSSSPDFRFLLQDLWAKRRWNMASFCPKGPKGLGGRWIYLTDLARRVLSWWLASGQALSLTGTGRIIYQILLQKSGITYSWISRWLKSLMCKRLGAKTCSVLACSSRWVEERIWLCSVTGISSKSLWKGVMESMTMVREWTLWSLSKVHRIFSSAHGYTMTDVLYQQLVEFSIFHQLFVRAFLTFLLHLKCV